MSSWSQLPALFSPSCCHATLCFCVGLVWGPRRSGVTQHMSFCHGGFTWHSVLQAQPCGHMWRTSPHEAEGMALCAQQSAIGGHLVCVHISVLALCCWEPSYGVLISVIPGKHPGEGCWVIVAVLFLIV